MPLALAGRLDEAEAVGVIHAALDAGMTWIDTADVYCLDDGDIGYGERLVARAPASPGRAVGIGRTPRAAQRGLRGKPQSARHRFDLSLPAACSRRESALGR